MRHPAPTSQYVISRESKGAAVLLSPLLLLALLFAGVVQLVVIDDDAPVAVPVYDTVAIGKMVGVGVIVYAMVVVIFSSIPVLGSR